MWLSNNKIVSIAFVYFIPLIMLNTFLSIFSIDTDLLFYYPPILILSIVAISSALKSKKQITISIVNGYLLYLLLSICLYTVNGVPINCYLFSILQTVFPILFVYLGYSFSDDNEYIKWLIYGCTICFIIGLIFYFTTPSFYVTYLSNLRNATWYSVMDADEATIMDNFRFSAIFADSYSVSYFSIPVLILSFSNIISHRVAINKTWLYIAIIVCFISAILCQQRIAIAFALLIPVYYALISIKEGIGSRLIIIYIGIIILLLGILSLVSDLDRWLIIKENVTDRFLNFNFRDAMSERTDQYIRFNRQTDWSLFLGLGLGTCGGQARSAGLIGVTDGWFVKSFYESGLLGMSLFVLLIVPSLLRGLKYYKLYNAELLIILYFLAACLGADALSATIPTTIFWYSIGRIWNPRYFRNLKHGLLNYK